MPLFEYACPLCGHIFEELTGSSDQTPKTCPTCNSAKAKKILSATRMSRAGKSSGPLPDAGGAGCVPRGGFS
jgi:putative FmdB family regulatory protein